MQGKLVMDFNNLQALDCQSHFLEEAALVCAWCDFSTVQLHSLRC